VLARAWRQGKSVDLEDIKFHQCVRLARFDNDRTISFIPPDGSFELMTYRLATAVKPLLWVDCHVERHSATRVEYIVKARSQFKERSNATGVQITLPVPADAIAPQVRVRRPRSLRARQAAVGAPQAFSSSRSPTSSRRSPFIPLPDTYERVESAGVSRIARAGAMLDGQRHLRAGELGVGVEDKADAWWQGVPAARQVLAAVCRLHGRPGGQEAAHPSEVRDPLLYRLRCASECAQPPAICHHPSSCARGTGARRRMANQARCLADAANSTVLVLLA
jgi:hypothetical protein